MTISHHSTFNQTTEGLDNDFNTYNETVFRFLRIAQISFAFPALISLILNVLIIHSIFSSKEWSKSPTYYLIGNMVTCDIMTASLFIAFSIVSCFTISFFSLDVICRALSVGTGISYMASVLSLTIISIDRYLSILKPFLFPSRNKKLSVIKSVIVLIWIISIMGALPFAIVTGAISGTDSTCGIIYRGVISVIYFLLLTLLLYLIPIITMAVLYVKIYHYWIKGIRRRSLAKNTTSNSFQGKFLTQMERKALIKTLVIVTAAFAIMSWPFLVMALALAISGVGIEDVEKKNTFLFVLCTIAVSCSASTSIANPMLLMKFDKNIHRRCINILAQFTNTFFSHNRRKIFVSYKPNLSPNTLSVGKDGLIG
ncbi:Trace amine-associated receptor 7d [Trichoplax sp. H2]|nr:Trace amine-associated receptor 7d [Trichoplax sp. H2]|eukprot:RDD39672.1 Trace amine-associated receptor 7d [Trichoplax sp. H2]